jgi:hypothetical protein
MRITYEIMSLADIWYISLDGGSACDKAAIYIGQQEDITDTEKPPDLLLVPNILVILLA